MILKTTRSGGVLGLSPLFTIAIFLLFSSLATAQTVTGIFPTRVTTGSKVTIIGTGFTNGDQSGIAIPNMSTGSKTFVSSTEMTFKITATTTSDRVGTLSITGVSSYSASRTFNYIAPTSNSISTTSENRVREVYTTWDQNGDGVNFWKSSDWSSSTSTAGKATWPNDSHELLGFKMNYGGNDIIFSTGIQESFFEAQLASLGVDVSSTSTEYVSQDFRAYSTNGISGKPNSNNYMGFADKLDGYTGTINLNNAVRKTVYDVIIDGEQGLDMGTGIANFNNDADIRFYSGNGDVGSVSDGVPDLLITQIAQPGGSDIYYYADVDGNVVGRPIKLSFINSNNTRLYQWRVDFFRLDYSAGATYETAIPTTASFGNGQTRGYRMAAFSLEDFGIDGSINANIDDIDNINIGAGGSSDMAFMAYNKAAFDIKSPVISESPVSRFICRLPSVSSLDFSVEGDIEGTPTSDPKEEITYTWFKNNVELSETSKILTIPSGLTSTDLINNNYKVRVANGYGAVDLPFTISKGGTPTYWDGSSWVLPAIYDDITVNDEDRSLIFSDDYNQSGDLIGCDCTVPAGKVVVIPDGSAMILFNTITVDPIIPATTEDGVAVLEVPAGSFTLKNNASLVQINDVVNSGDIKVERLADGLHTYDYVYWSTPVEDFNISNIPSTLKFEWHTNEGNANSSYGDWSAASGIMSIGRGYIARVPSSTSFTTSFFGVPNNGDINWTVYKTTSGSLATIDKHWNLVGNPYPSALNADKFLDKNTTIEGSVYLWKHDVEIAEATDQSFYENFPVNYGDQYVTWNHLGGSDPSGDFDGNIASGQAFFMQVLEGSADISTIEFNNDMRYDSGENDYSNSQFYRGSNQEEEVIQAEKQLLWLSLANENNKASSTLIGYAEGATEGKDRLYDAYTNNEGFNMYSLISEEEKLAIQGLPLPFVDTNTVHLGFSLTENGIYRIAIGNLKGSLFVDQAQSIYLEDTYSGIIHDLRGSPYAFTGVQGEFNDRFILRYINATLSISDVSASNTFAYINHDMLNVKSDSGIEAIKVYDLSGREVIAYTFNGQRNTVNENFQFSKGVYLVTITLEDNIIVTKKIIN